MTKGEGLIGLLYAFKDLVEDSAIALITGAAVIGFFFLVLRFIYAQRNGSKDAAKYKNQIFLALVLLFVIFSVYSLIALTGAIFGVNSSPNGGIYLEQ